MPFWVRLMQVWAKRPLLSPKDKKPWPCVPLPKTHSRAPTKRLGWRKFTLYWGMLITRFPFSSGCYRYHTAVRCFLLLRRCDSIRSGIKSATILAFRNWPQKRNRELGKLPSELAVCRVKHERGASIVFMFVKIVAALKERRQSGNPAATLQRTQTRRQICEILLTLNTAN